MATVKKKRSRKFVVLEGKQILVFQSVGGGWYTVTNPLVPAAVSQAKTLEEGFANMKDAAKLVQQYQDDMRKKRKRR